jgi:mevalonate kinase
MRFFSRGKILLTGEYSVLLGAKALAVPSRLGQYLEVNEQVDPGKILINSFLNDQLWFSCTFESPGFNVLETTDQNVSSFVRELFLQASQMKPGFFTNHRGIELRSTLEFDTRWGLGSSSSLISNLAWWLKINPYDLFWRISPGSGYDIACARANQPIIYQLVEKQPDIRPVNFNPSFKESIFFVYLGNKQDSQYSVREFKKRKKPNHIVVEKISMLSEAISITKQLEEFTELITEHEAIMSEYLGAPAVKQSRFPGFKGVMKSLGAWGGDLILVTWKDEEEQLRKYFSARGLNLVFRYGDLI